MYDASKSNELKCLESIQRACLRAITGAFRSSPAVNLCMETGMLPLDLSHDMLTLKHFFKIQNLPNSPAHRAVGDPTPRMEHINELCTQYRVQTPEILTNFVPEIPSWTYPPISGIVHSWKQRNRVTQRRNASHFPSTPGEAPQRYIFIRMALSPPKVWALQQCFLTSPVVADLPERLQYSQQNCMQ